MPVARAAPPCRRSTSLLLGLSLQGLSEASVGVSSLPKSGFHALPSSNPKAASVSHFPLETSITGQKSGNPGSPTPKPEQDLCPHTKISFLYIQCIWSYIRLYTSLYVYIISVSFSLGQPSICTMSYFPSLHLRLVCWSKGDSGHRFHWVLQQHPWSSPHPEYPPPSVVLPVCQLPVSIRA